MKLPINIVELLQIKSINDTTVYLASSSLSGNTNLYISPYTDVYLDEYILLPDLFAQKTKVNFNENRYALISIVNPNIGNHITIEGPANIIQWGHPDRFAFYDLRAKEVLQKWGKWEEQENIYDLSNEARPGVLAQRGVIVVKAEKIHYN